MTDTSPPLCKCGQPCVRVLGGSYQRLCQPCILALPRPDTGSAAPGAARKRKRRAQRLPDAYTPLAAIDDEEAAWLRREERRRR